MDPITLYFGMWSIHAQAAENQTHNLIGIQIEQLFVGHFRNSLDKDSWIVGVEFFERDVSDTISIRVAGGFMSGYENEEQIKSNDIVPYFMPGLKWQFSEKLAAEFNFGGNVASIGFSTTF